MSILDLTVSVYKQQCHYLAGLFVQTRRQSMFAIFDEKMDIAGASPTSTAQSTGAPLKLILMASTSEDPMITKGFVINNISEYF